MNCSLRSLFWTSKFALKQCCGTGQKIGELQLSQNSADLLTNRLTPHTISIDAVSSIEVCKSHLVGIIWNVLELINNLVWFKLNNFRNGWQQNAHWTNKTLAVYLIAIKHLRGELRLLFLIRYLPPQPSMYLLDQVIKTREIICMKSNESDTDRNLLQTQKRFAKDGKSA